MGGRTIKSWPHINAVGGLGTQKKPSRKCKKGQKVRVGDEQNKIFYKSGSNCTCEEKVHTK